MIRSAMSTTAKADHISAGGDRTGRAHGRILQDRAVRDIDADRGGGMEIEVGRRLTARDMLATREDLVAKRVANTEMLKMTLDPAGRARRRDGAGEIRR